MKINNLKSKHMELKRKLRWAILILFALSMLSCNTVKEEIQQAQYNFNLVKDTYPNYIVERHKTKGYYFRILTKVDTFYVVTKKGKVIKQPIKN